MSKLRLKRNFLIVASILCAAVNGASMAHAERDIVYSARYYLKPNGRSTRKASSYFHLYRINADGSRRTQITFGAHDDGLPLWSPNGRHIAFFRDNKALYLCDADGRRMVKLLDTSQFDQPSLRWSPDGKTLGIVHDSSSEKLSDAVIYLIDVRTRHARRVADATSFAWSPDNRKLALISLKAGVRVLDIQSGHSVNLSQSNVGSLTWTAPNRIVVLVQSPDENAIGIRQIAVFDARGRNVRRFDMAKNGDGDLPDFRSSVAPIPGTTQDFTFAFDQSTSSGHDEDFFHVSALTNQMTHLAEGQSLSWAPNEKRFLRVTYHDTSPYDTLPNGHKRVVYTTKLQVGTSEKNLRDLVSGLVYVDSADWRALPH